MDLEADFKNAMMAAGITPPDKIEFDDEFHRFSTKDGKRDDAGFYKVTIDNSKAQPFAFGFFGNWRDDVTVPWHSKGAEPEWVKEVSRKNTSARSRAAELRNNERAKTAQWIFENSRPLSPGEAHPYMERKGIQSFPGTFARIYKDEVLVIAMRNADKQIRSIQFINAEKDENGRDKRFLKGAATAGLYAGLGAVPDPSKRIWIAEGAATGDAVAKITGSLVIVAFSAANVPEVARIIAGKLPNQICIAGDSGEAGETKAHAAATEHNGLVAIPPAEQQLGDWNDAVNELGLDTARELFESVMQEPTLVKKDPAPMEEPQPVGAEPEPTQSESKSPAPVDPQPPIEPPGIIEEPPEPEDWRLELMIKPATKTTPEMILPNELNTLLFLDNHQDFKGCFATDEMSCNDVIVKWPYWYKESRKRGRELPAEINDLDMIDLHCRLQGLGIGIVRHKFDACAIRVIRDRQIHPLRDKLLSVEWDGVNRLDTWVIDLLGAEDTAINRVFGRKFLIGATKRLIYPGCQMDTALILEGKQGSRKSTFCRELAYDYFTDEHIDMRNKDGSLMIRGNFICELAELTALSQKDVESVKAFIARRTDKFRLPYAKMNTTWNRNNVFIGTTNSDEYLKDHTGNRRFWSIKCGEIDIDGLIECRDQLWAEAIVAMESGAPHWLEGEEIQEHKVTADSRGTTDTWRIFIEQYIAENGLQIVTTQEIVQNVMLTGEQNRMQVREYTGPRIAAVLKQMGWHHDRNLRLNWAPGKFGIRPRPFWHPDLPEDLSVADMRNLAMHKDYHNHPGWDAEAGPTSNVVPYPTKEPDFQ